jgi:hypothetical protein
MNQVSHSFGKVVNSNKRYIEIVALTLIILQFAPFEAMGPVGMRAQAALSPIFNPVRTMMSFDVVKVFLFLVLVFSCFIRKDMNLFFILSLYFIIDRM